MKKYFPILVCSLALQVCRAQDVALPVHIHLASLMDFEVLQRSASNAGSMIVAGTVTADSPNPLLPDKLEARLTGDSLAGPLPGQWQSLPCDGRVAAFSAALPVPAGGWYRLEVRAWRNGGQVADIVVEHVGVGEIFVIAGQSNAANYGEEKQATQTGLVAAFDGAKWQLAKDPEPGAGGAKGSFMPLFGDELVEHFHVPVGLVATAVGSTSVREWLPAGTLITPLPPRTRNVVTVGNGQWAASGKLFENLTARMQALGTNGFRAVLWHQGESDAKQADPSRTLPGKLYQQDLEALIRDSRRVAGWEAPWFVAQASYHNPGDPASPDIRAAQKSVCDDGLAFPGPDTDTLTGDMREKNGTGIHMSAKGLKAHAHLWFQKITPWLEQQLVAN